MKSNFSDCLIIFLITQMLCDWLVSGAPLYVKHHIKKRRTEDIIAGQEFLSLFLPENKQKNQPQFTILPLILDNNRFNNTSDEIGKTTVISNVISAATPSIAKESVYLDNLNNTSYENNLDNTSFSEIPIIRDSRSTVFDYQTNFDDDKNTNPDQNYDVYQTTIPLTNNKIKNDSESQVLAISVSKSIGTQTHKEIPINNFTKLNNTSELDDTKPSYSLTIDEQINADSNNNPAQNKNILHVDEMEPMTIENPLKYIHDTVQKHEQILLGANPDYIAQQQLKNKETYRHHQPPGYHHTIVFHGQLNKDYNRARSVSYSSVLQNIPNSPINSGSNWEQQEAESIERPSYIQNYHHQILLKDLQNNYKYGDSSKLENTTPSDNSQWSQPLSSFQTLYSTPKYSQEIYPTPEQNYEIDEAVSVMTNGRAHGIVQTAKNNQYSSDNEQLNDEGRDEQEYDDSTDTSSSTVQSTKTDNNSNNHKVGYVVEGRNFRKYRVEERTSDGFIVGEYGVVRHDDGSLRGVRYTADGTINPRLIYDALMKFLSL